MAEKLIGDIPQMGYGTWQHLGEEAYNGVSWALEAGCRHIDTAQGYKNEEEVGRAIKDSEVPRDDIHVATKVAPENYGPGQVIQSTKESLEKLQLDQVDLLLLHWPSPNDEYPLESYISQLAETLDTGLTKHIGVSNFTIPLIDEASKLLGDRPITTNQCEIHVYMQNRPIVEHCQSIDIPMTAYCPLARARLVGDPTLTDIGEKHDATDAQIALAFLMAEGHIVIPSSSKKDRIISNFAARNIELADDEVARIRTLDKGMRLVKGEPGPEWDV